MIYEPWGTAKDVLLCRDPEVLFAGPAGTGKSRACLEKLHLCCLKYPGSRWLVGRKTRKSVTETALVTFEQHVAPPLFSLIAGAKRQQRHVYTYPNGSEIVVGGFDNPQKIMSSEYDGVYIQEAVECTEDDVEMISTRLRNGKMPYQQLLMDCNPDTPHHWLYRRYERGIVTKFDSRHEDNPRLWNGKDWTEEGKSYLEKLDRLTGTRHQRLRLGLWVIPEGARFPNIDPSEHLFDFATRFPRGIPEAYTRFVSVDYGLAAPYCALWHCVDMDGNVYTYQERYESGLTADRQAEDVRNNSFDNEYYYALYYDPTMDAEFPGHLGKPGVCASDLYKEILEPDPRFGAIVPGLRDKNRRISGMASLDRLLNRGNGHPDWFIERGCENLWRELQDARFHRTPHGIWLEDLDPQCDDHAITAAYYGLRTHFQVPEEREDELTIDSLQRQRMEARRKASERNFARLQRRFDPTKRRLRY